MTTVEEIAALLRGLSAASLEEARTFIEFLRRKESPGAATWSFDFLTKLKFSIGIRDGAELPDDRCVAFRVLVNGWKLWSTVKNAHAWEEHEVVMPRLGSDVVRIEFVTDGLR